MNLFHEGSGVAEMCRLETREGLYEAFTHVRAEQEHAMKSMQVDVWPQRLGRTSERVLQALSKYVLKVVGGFLKKDARKRNVY